MEFFALVLFFWVPFSIIFIKNLLWDLYIWKHKEYRFSRYFTALFWDHNEKNRNELFTDAKFILFSAASTILISPLLTVGAIFVSYIVWILEIFDFIKRIISGQLRVVGILKPRNLFTILLVLALIVPIVVYISIPFMEVVRGSNGNTLNLSLNGSLLFTPVNVSYPDAYLYLGFSTLFALFLDLASPLILTVALFITSPISWLENKLTVQKLKSVLRENKHVIFVAVCGSIGKTITKEVLYNILKDKHNVAKTDDVYSSITSLSKELIRLVNRRVEVVIMEIEGYRPGEIKEICEIVRPHIAIYTDTDIQHLGLFKNVQEYIDSRLELAKYMDFNGVLINNYDDKYVRQSLKAFPGEKLSYTTKRHNIKDEPGTIVNVSGIRKSSTGYKFKLKYENLDTEIHTNSHSKIEINPIVASVLAAHKLGLTTKYIQEQLRKTYFDNFDQFETKGDNSSIIIVNKSINTNLRGIIYSVNYANTLKNKIDYDKLILFTDGIPELGRFKRKAYKKLIAHLDEDIDFLVTTDSLLFNSSKAASFLPIKADNINDAIYQLRAVMREKDVVVVEGEKAQEVIESLRSEDQ